MKNTSSEISESGVKIGRPSGHVAAASWSRRTVAGLLLVVRFLDPEENRHRGDEDLAGGEGGEDRGAHPAVESERLDDRLDHRADAAHGAVGEGFRFVGAVVFRIGAERPEQDGKPEDDGSRLFHEGPARGPSTWRKI